MSIFQPLNVALWITVPVVLAGLTHVAVIKLRLFPSLAAIPLDFGATVAGKRLFGENKTLRGVLVMIVVTAAWVFLQVTLFANSPWARALEAPFEQGHPLAWGALVGAGYVTGELPNSFIKRRLGIGPGLAARGWARAFFWVVDQVDSVLGILVFLSPVWMPSYAIILALLGVALIVHPAVAFVMFCLGLKARVG